jgi:hypothetical protein
MVLNLPYLFRVHFASFLAGLNSELAVLKAASMSRLFRLQSDCTQRLIRYENS